MKLNKIEISNVLGLARADIQLKGVNVISGLNGAGKSSLADAISMAFLGMPRRVDLKKELGQLLHEESAKGRVSIQFGDEEQGAEFRLPKGEHLVSEIAGGQFLPFVLDPQKFASLTGDERRTMLFGLTGIKASGKLIAEKLAARGISEAVIEEFAPMLRRGFPSASKEAYSRATQSKGAWRQVTGQNWGAVVAEGWTAPAPESAVPTDAQLEAIFAEHEKFDGEVKKGTKFLGTLEEKRKASDSWLSRKQAAADTADQLVRRQAKQKATEDQIAEWEPKLADLISQLSARKAGAEPVQCPCCQAELKIVGNTLEKFEGLKADTKVTTDLALEVSKARSAVDLLKRTLQNDMASVAEAQAAANIYDQILAEKIENVDDALVEKAKAALEDQQAKATAKRAEYNAGLEARDQAKAIAQKTSDAAKAHAAVKTWLAVGDALAPDGIPGELLADALAPVNQSVSVLAGLCGWKPATIQPDMTITYGGRLYALCSESEQWRADALFALAIAQISQLRMVVLDRFDVLDLKSRGALLKMLIKLEQLETMDTMLMVGTMKELPNLPASVAGVWVTNAIAETTEA